MANARKPDFVFRRNGRVHLNRPAGGVSSVDCWPAEVCAISGSNAGYTVFRGSVKGNGYPSHSPVSPSLPLPRVTVCHHISTAIYLPAFRRNVHYECGGNFGLMGFVLCLQMCAVSTDACFVYRCVLCLQMRVVSTDSCYVYRFVLCLQMRVVSTDARCVQVCVLSKDVCCVYRLPGIVIGMKNNFGFNLLAPEIYIFLILAHPVYKI